MSRFNPNGTPVPAAWEGRRRERGYFDHLRRKLRWRLLVAYATPLLLLAVYFHFQYGATLRARIDNHLVSVAENRRNTVDLFLLERLANLRSASRALAPAIPPPDGALESALEELRGNSPTFVDVGLFDPQGTLLRYAGPHVNLRGRSYAREAWWLLLTTEGRDYLISDVYLGLRGKPHFIIAVRWSINGRPWVLRASVDPEKFGEFVRSSRIAGQAQAFIVNPSGERQTLGGDEDISLRTPYVPERTEETRVTRLDFGDADYLCAFSWLREHDWVLVARTPTDVAFAPLRRARLTLTGIMLLTLAGIVVLVDRNTRGLVGRLQEADAAKEDLKNQLFHAAKLASVGEMAAGVAHEINNPLAIIHEEAGMMKDTLDPQFGRRTDLGEFAERLDAILQACQRGRSVTSKLLAFSRQHEPTPEPCEINELVRRVLEAKQVEFKVSDIEVRTELANDLPRVLVSPNQMEQVLFNLLNNARDAIRGPGRITVRTGRDERWVRLEVRDTGCGMSEEQMGKIFFPFYTTKGVGRGTGLGLSISYGIIRSLGGLIEVESEPGRGATFTVLLPPSSGAERDESSGGTSRDAIS